MDLLEFPIDQLFLGMSLRYTLRDAQGQLLLTKGQKIETEQQLAGIKGRQKVYVEMTQTGEGARMVMSSFSALNKADAPIKDFSRFLDIKKTGPVEDVSSGTLVQRWGDVESRLGGVLGSVSAIGDFESRIYLLQRHMADLLVQDTPGSQFLLFNRAVTHFGGYSVLHSLLCAMLVNALAEKFGLSEAQQRSLVCAALTMNVAMTQLQDQLALQKAAPSPVQRHVIDHHAAEGKKLLETAGVSDKDWLTMVLLHHKPLGSMDDFADWPVLKRMVKILQTVDRYTAAMSPRKSRSGRNARDSVRAVVVQEGATKHDEVGTALVQLLGLCPPGTFVKLANGETAVVMRRGLRPAEPWVAGVLNRQDQAIAEPSVRDTSRETFVVQSTLSATAIRVNLNIDQMLRLMPKSA